MQFVRYMNGKWNLIQTKICYENISKGSKKGLTLKIKYGPKDMKSRNYEN